jgi:hypothetical protein
MCVLELKNAPTCQWPVCLAALPLLCLFFTFVHEEVGFAEVLGKDPAHAGAGSVRQCFVLCFHAGTPDGVGVFASDCGDVVVAGYRALEALMIDIISTRETVAKVVLLLDGVGVWDAVGASSLLASLGWTILLVLWAIVIRSLWAKLIAMVLLLRIAMIPIPGWGWWALVGAHAKRAGSIAAAVAATVVALFLASLLGTGAILVMVWGYLWWPLLLM